MMKKLTKIVAIILSCVMLLGSSLSISANERALPNIPSDRRCTNRTCNRAQLKPNKYYDIIWECPICGKQYWNGTAV